MAILLSKRQREVLQLMENGEELVQDSSGKGWPHFWIGDDRTSYSVWWTLVRNVLISTREAFDSKVIYWYINESGKRLLKGETKIYSICDKKGNIVLSESWHMAHSSSG